MMDIKLGASKSHEVISKDNLELEAGHEIS